jgi:hypothetical protein
LSVGSITGHFCGEYDEFPDTSNTAYLDIFSCKSFDEEKYFDQEIINYHVVVRARPLAKLDTSEKIVERCH